MAFLSPVSRWLLLGLVPVFAVSVLIQPSFFHQRQLVAGFLTVVAFFSLVNGMHVACSWRMFYLNPVLRERWSKTYFAARFLALPAVYGLLCVGLTFLLWERLPGSRLLVLWLVIAGPLTALHFSSQDFGILQMGSRNGQDARWRRRFFFPLLLALFCGIYMRPFLGLDFARELLGPWNSRLQSGSAAASALGVVLCLAAALREKPWKGGRWEQALYLCSVAIFCGGQLMLAAGLGLLFVTRVFIAIHHHLLYIDLVQCYERGRRKLDPAGGSFSLALFLLGAFLLAAPLIGGIFITSLEISGSSALLLPAWLQGAAPWIIPLSAGVFAACILHHYDIDRFCWKFSDPELGPHLRRCLSAGKAAYLP